MAKRKFLGLPFPVFCIVLVLAVLFIVGFIAGPVGKPLLSKLFGLNLELPGWITVSRPEIKLPAEEVFRVFGLPITNSLIGSWLTIIFLVLFSFIITRRLKLVPGRLQVAFEFLLGLLYNLCESVAGEKNGRRFFPIVATIFLFVLFNAWLSLLPGFGSITIVNPEGVAVPLLRAANTDIYTPLALALVSFVCVEFFGLRSHGIRYLSKFINVGQFFTSIKQNAVPFFRSIGQIATGRIGSGISGLLDSGINIFIGLVNVAVGLLETLSELVRIVSFTFRLFGNMTAGEILLLIVVFLVPWVVVDVFYGLELLVGVVQALIFSVLTLVFLTIATITHGEETH